MEERKRILFVEDDPAQVEGIKESFRDMGAVWELGFVDSGEKALDAFALSPYDVIVSGLALPGMDGGQLLQTIQARNPATIRFVLVDGQDPAKVAGMTDRAHQFLHKPCDSERLKSVLRRTFLLKSQVQNDHTRELVARIGRLPSVPALYVEITRLMGSERTTVENLGETIGKDMAMTAMILKLANSAFFGQRQAVTTPAEAVSILGIDLLRSLVLAYGLFSQSGGFRYPTFGLSHLWHHSLAVASAAKQIAEMEGLGRAFSADCFTAGLLHDVGILVLASRFPEDYNKVLVLSRKEGKDLETAEFHILGTTHGEVGAYLLGLWGLPPDIVEAAAWHHQPRFQKLPAFTPGLAVHIADSLLSEDPEHEIFSTAALDLSHLADLGMGERVSLWRRTLQQSPAGMQDFFA